MTEFWSVILVICSTLLSSLGSFYMKVASKSFHNIKTVITNLPLISALSFHTLSAVIGVIAYRGGELTVLVPLASLNYIWASLLAINYLGENMNKWKWVGVVSIMLGITIIGFGDVL